MSESNNIIILNRVFDKQTLVYVIGVGIIGSVVAGVLVEIFSGIVIFVVSVFLSFLFAAIAAIANLD